MEQDVPAFATAAPEPVDMTEVKKEADKGPIGAASTPSLPALLAPTAPVSAQEERREESDAGERGVDLGEDFSDSDSFLSDDFSESDWTSDEEEGGVAVGEGATGTSSRD